MTSYYPAHLEKLFTNDIPKIKQLQIYVFDEKDEICHNYMNRLVNSFHLFDRPIWFLPHIVQQDHSLPAIFEKHAEDIVFVNGVDGIARLENNSSSPYIPHHIPLCFEHVIFFNDDNLSLRYHHQTQTVKMNFSDEDITTDEQRNIAQKIRDLQSKIHPQMVDPDLYNHINQIWTQVHHLNNLINQETS